MTRQLAVMLAVACLAGSGRSGDWSQWRGSNRDLIVTEERLLPEWPVGGPQRLWHVELPGEGYSEPIVVGGTLYITGSSGEKKSRVGHLFALDPKSGAIRWQVEYGPEWG
ncbi:MAG TPA: PQQ-binding-like beta-propeller repeat protein, partial [Kiritimatiellia bacterium]|nr:PQQ-binding-like beta-propeller repeat protein [Kiritimatiellia bacterium]